MGQRNSRQRHCQQFSEGDDRELTQTQIAEIANDPDCVTVEETNALAIIEESKYKPGKKMVGMDTLPEFHCMTQWVPQIHDYETEMVYTESICIKLHAPLAQRGLSIRRFLITTLAGSVGVLSNWIRHEAGLHGINNPVVKQRIGLVRRGICILNDLVSCEVGVLTTDLCMNAEDMGKVVNWADPAKRYKVASSIGDVSDSPYRALNEVLKQTNGMCGCYYGKK